MRKVGFRKGLVTLMFCQYGCPGKASQLCTLFLSVTMNLIGKFLPANLLLDLLDLKTKYSQMWDVRAKFPCLPASSPPWRSHLKLFTCCCQDAKGGLISHQEPGMQHCGLGWLWAAAAFQVSRQTALGGLHRGP